jgi:hypothetical protein
LGSFESAARFCRAFDEQCNVTTFLPDASREKRCPLPSNAGYSGSALALGKTCGWRLNPQLEPWLRSGGSMLNFPGELACRQF